MSAIRALALFRDSIFHLTLIATSSLLRSLPLPSCSIDQALTRPAPGARPFTKMGDIPVNGNAPYMYHKLLAAYDRENNKVGDIVVLTGGVLEDWVKPFHKDEPIQILDSAKVMDDICKAAFGTSYVDAPYE